MYILVIIHTCKFRDPYSWKIHSDPESKYIFSLKSFHFSTNLTTLSYGELFTADPMVCVPSPENDSFTDFEKKNR